MKTKRLLSVLLALALMFSMVACGTSNTPSTSGTTGTTSSTTTDTPAATTTDTPEATTDEAPAAGAWDGREAQDLADIIPSSTVELTVYSQLANYSGEQIGWFGKVMLDRFNVKLNIINSPEGMYATRMASGDLGDIVIWGNDADEYLQAVAAGMLYDWEDDNLLADYGPYINDNMEKALEKNRTLSGGTVYGFGHNVGTSTTDHESFFYYPDIRWDLYEKLGHPKVSTLEDYIPILEQMVALEPTSDTGGKTYGASMFKDWDGNMVMFVKSTGALYGYDEFGFGLYNVNTQTYEDALMEGGMYLRALKFYNTLYQKGLLHPDSMTQTFNDMIEHYQTGAAFFNIFSWMASSNYNTEAHLAQGKAMMPLAADDAKNITYGLNVYGENRIWSIGSKTAYPELCMAIINWFATPEGKMVTLYGPQGLMWDYDSEGNPFLTDLGAACQMDQETVISGDGYSGTWNDGTFKMNNTTWNTDASNPDSNGFTYNKNFWDSWLINDTSEIKERWRDFAGALSPDEYFINNGHISIAIGSTYSESTKSDELQVSWDQVKEAIKNGSWSAIYAKTDDEYDKAVADMITKAKSYGYDDCVAFTTNEAARKKQLEIEASK